MLDVECCWSFSIVTNINILFFIRYFFPFRCNSIPCIIRVHLLLWVHCVHVLSCFIFHLRFAFFHVFLLLWCAKLMPFSKCKYCHLVCKSFMQLEASHMQVNIGIGFGIGFLKTRFNNNDSRRLLSVKSKKDTNGKELIVRRIIRYVMGFSPHG